jgi:hypothetical protein
MTLAFLRVSKVAILALFLARIAAERLAASNHILLQERNEKKKSPESCF